MLYVEFIILKFVFIYFVAKSKLFTKKRILPYCFSQFSDKIFYEILTALRIYLFCYISVNYM